MQRQIACPFFSKAVRSPFYNKSLGDLNVEKFRLPRI